MIASENWEEADNVRIYL